MVNALAWRDPPPAADPTADLDEAGFLAAVRAFLSEALTADLREAGRHTIGVYSDIEAGEVWYRRLAARGWIAPAWPVEWGGTGWSARQRFLFDRECALNDAPVLFASGVRTIGPLLIEAGTPWQRARYLHAILSGDDLWCQGFSEPGAGSDLAALTTRAVRDDGVYRVTGSKIWTTGAHLANRMFALVRTGEGGRKQEGLTFLLIDMETPGVIVRPILSLSGEHEFNEVFLDDVHVPLSHRVGAEGEGWAVAKRLMQLARSNNTPSALVRRALRRARALAEAAGDGLEPALAARLTSLEVELAAYEALELRSLPSGRPRPDQAEIASMIKLVGTELHQRVVEAAMEAAGPSRAPALAAIAGLEHDELDHLADGGRIMAKHLAVRASSIYSGASETQRNVIARQLLAP